jgi:demethylmenaquinone methyltransferase / 2-methoxy-6-polyprenyl-1,4-benzoquinol methylase
MTIEELNSTSTLVSSKKNTHARHLFDGIAGNYDGPAQVFSFFQYLRWRRFLVSRLKISPQAQVLDVATGPAGVAIYIAGKTGCQVTGMDISDLMLKQAGINLRAANLTSTVSLVKGRAENLPFPDHAFDVVVFTFLFRYVDEPQAVMHELARVLKPGGQIASLEFYVPKGPVLHPLWLLHTRLVMPLGTRFMAPGWREVGSFLGPNISDFFRKYTLADLHQMWKQAGLNNVQTALLSQGGAFVMWGQKE